MIRLLPLDTLKQESKCSALGRHGGSFWIMLGVTYGQWLVKREQVATKWTLISLSTQRPDVS